LKFQSVLPRVVDLWQRCTAGRKRMAPSPLVINEPKSSTPSSRRRRPGSFRGRESVVTAGHLQMRQNVFSIFLCLAGGVMYRCALHPEGFLFNTSSTPALKFISAVSESWSPPLRCATLTAAACRAACTMSTNIVSSNFSIHNHHSSQVGDSRQREHLRPPLRILVVAHSKPC